MIYRVLLCSLLIGVFFTACKNENDPSEQSVSQTSSSGEAEKAKSVVEKETSTISHKTTWESVPKWPAKRAANPFYPFDEAYQDESLLKFRAQLWKAIHEKDASFLLSVTDENIKIDFGAHNGKENFMKAWQLDSRPKSSELWNKLKAVLKLGGGFRQYISRDYCAPYLFIIDEIKDPFDEAIVIGDNVRMRDAPSTEKGKILKTLSWEKVTRLRERPGKKKPLKVKPIIGEKSKQPMKQKDISGENICAKQPIIDFG